MAKLDLQSIQKSFGSIKVPHDINLEIKDWEFIAFVGPSGCGKSTLLRVIAGLEEASGGKIIIGDQDVSDKAPVERGISMVFQSYVLYPHLSVFENIAFPLRVQKPPKDEVTARVERGANILQLTDKLHLKPGQLSGGQRQRAAIGRSIVRNPSVFLFDEPLSNLDAALRGDMRVELSQLHKSLETTMVYVTHDQVEAMTMADRIVVLQKGRVEQFGTPMELYNHPKTKFVAGFIGQPNINFWSATVVDAGQSATTVQLKAGEVLKLLINALHFQEGDEVELGVRTEHITLAGASNETRMKVRVVERLDNVTIAYGVVGEDAFCMTFQGDVQLDEGQDIQISIQPETCYLFDKLGDALPRLVQNDNTPITLSEPQ